MKKRLFCLFVLVCMVCSILCACGSTKEITSEEAVAIVMEDLGDSAALVNETHIHTGTYNDKECYNIYVAIGDMNWQYVVSLNGDILANGPSSHSH